MPCRYEWSAGLQAPAAKRLTTEDWSLCRRENEALNPLNKVRPPAKQLAYCFSVNRQVAPQVN